MNRALPGRVQLAVWSPVFEKTSIDLTNGNTFTIIAKNASKKNKYIQSAKLNGKVYNKVWFTHGDILNGAILELIMGEYPNKEWGAGLDAAPASKIEILK